MLSFLFIGPYFSLHFTQIPLFAMHLLTAQLSSINLFCIKNEDMKILDIIGAILGIASLATTIQAAGEESGASLLSVTI